MKVQLNNFGLKAYIRFMRKQNKHIQHVHAIAFAGIITALITGGILYTDYGFWHETYKATDGLVVGDQIAPDESPIQSLGRFFEVAKDRFKNMGSSTVNYFEGKETYSSGHK